MSTFRCAACGEALEFEEIKELDLIEVKPCEVCLNVAEEESHERGNEDGYEEGWQAGYDSAIEDPEYKNNLERKKAEGFKEGFDSGLLAEKQEDTKDSRY